MSSRGAVYAKDTVKKVSDARRFTATKGKGGRRPGEDFHDDCRCDGVAVRSDDELPYDAEALYKERYMPARNAEPTDLIKPSDFSSEAAYEKALHSMAGVSDKAIAARMRFMFGGN